MDSDNVAQFAGITGSSEHIAAQYLRLAEGNTEQAIELFYANDGVDLEPTAALPQRHDVPPPVPPTSTRPNGYGQAREDENGVVHIDSDPEDPDYVEEDDEVQITGRNTRQKPPVAGASPTAVDPGNAIHSTGQAGGAVDDDEALARRLQEESYGGANWDRSNGNTNADALDEYGYRAPLGRTTETLVGPGSFDPTNAEEMRAAVTEQIMARRQHPRHRGRFEDPSLISLLGIPLIK